ncbi:MAG: glycosyl hydrolase 53 family protein [Clostridiales bacterium]|nr:glycosyl hydrolase 53 family protein [Clostridiales bacterium]
MRSSIKKFWKRCLTLVAAVALTLTMMPSSVYATEVGGDEAEDYGIALASSVSDSVATSITEGGTYVIMNQAGEYLTNYSGSSVGYDSSFSDSAIWTATADSSDGSYWNLMNGSYYLEHTWTGSSSDWNGIWMGAQIWTHSDAQWSYDSTYGFYITSSAKTISINDEDTATEANNWVGFFYMNEYDASNVAKVYEYSEEDVYTVTATINGGGDGTSLPLNSTVPIVATVYKNGTALTSDEWDALGYHIYYTMHPTNNNSEWKEADSDDTLNASISITTDENITFETGSTYYLYASLQDSGWDEISGYTINNLTVTENTEGWDITSLSADPSSPIQNETVSLTAALTNAGVSVTDDSSLTDDNVTLTWTATADGSDMEDAVFTDDSGIEATVSFPSVGDYTVTATLSSESGEIATETITITVSKDEVVHDAEINVKKVDGLSDDFIMGMDISTIVSEYASGVKYYDYDGNELSTITQFCQFLADNGVTSIRVRIWNDPYDSNGNTYGAGTCDVDTAVTIASACANAGLDMLIDFHYSDFWADPGKYQEPKAWAGYTVAQKETAIKDFTSETLTKIADTGATISMVQVGNETTGGICGVSNKSDMCTLFNAGSAAVRSFSKTTYGSDDAVKVVIHVTDPESGNMTSWASTLSTYNVDYDVLATSYYPFWHGTYANLESQMETVEETYGKDVMVAETSYVYTLDDTDGTTNSVTSITGDETYAATVQGQASAMRDVIAAVSDAGGLGIYYWEPAWITVGDTTGLDDTTNPTYDEQVAANMELWEEYGSGWATSASTSYASDTADYGGSQWDNQALFYPDGYVTAAMHVWEYVRGGASTDKLTVEDVESFENTVSKGTSVTLPTTVDVTYSDSGDESVVSEQVTWNPSSVDTSSIGTTTYTGTSLL